MHHSPQERDGAAAHDARAVTGKVATTVLHVGAMYLATEKRSWSGCLGAGPARSGSRRIRWLRRRR